jgi:hypothetical protein
MSKFDDCEILAVGFRHFCEKTKAISSHGSWSFLFRAASSTQHAERSFIYMIETDALYSFGIWHAGKARYDWLPVNRADFFSDQKWAQITQLIGQAAFD